MKPPGYKSGLHLYVIFLVLLIGMLAAGFGMVLYNITIQKPDGQIALSKWPIDFAREFSGYIPVVDDVPTINASGLKLLRANHLWLQILDSNGDEIQSVDRPLEIPGHYSPADLLEWYQYGSGNYSVFFGSLQSGAQQWTYVIGFPVQISRVTLYVNKDRFATLKPIAYVTFGVALLLLTVSASVYSLIIARQTERIRQAIREIAARAYLPSRSSGSFDAIYEELSALNQVIEASDAARQKTEKQREEWIANITHDLKTPLSPIKGYAEVIADPDSEAQPEDLRKYGGVILKNTAYAEALINDLKLTFQLGNDILTLNKSRQNLVRFTRELVIDMLNNPEYAPRSIAFYSPSETIEFSFDPVYLKRALINLLTNALVHNRPDTSVSISIRAEGEKINIGVQDNGRGMDRDELDQLFTRYYRGNSTDAKPEGSGLGMAIAKQIIEQHGGRILAKSEVGSGTRIVIEFPAQT